MTEAELKALIKMGESETLTAENRAQYKGEYIKTAMGTTHYELKGEGEAVVLVHGYSTPYFIYDKVFEGLVNLGYKVLRYDLFGRGFSDRLSGKNNQDFFAKQLDEVTTALLGDEKFVLVGTSMGGAITTTYIKNYAEKARVKKLVLLAPAGMDTFKAPFYMHLCSFPVLGDILFPLIGDKVLIGATQKELYYCPQEEKDYYTRSFAEGCKYKGFLKSTLSSLRNTILKTDVSMLGYRAVAQMKLPMLVVWGTIDKTMPYYQHERLLETCPHAKLITFENSGHNFVFDEGEKTMEAIKDFIA